MLNGANQHISFINETPEGTDSRGLRNVNDFDNHSMAEYRGGANSSSLLADNHQLLSQKPPTASEQNPRNPRTLPQVVALKRNNLAIDDDDLLIQQEVESQNIQELLDQAKRKVGMTVAHDDGGLLGDEDQAQPERNKNQDKRIKRMMQLLD